MNHLEEQLAQMKAAASAGPHAERILAELAYACAVSKIEEGQYDALVGRALSYLQQRARDDGAITREAAFAAEKMLLDMKQAAKAYTVLCCAHAHIDMNWEWGFPETVMVTLDTFRTMLDLMEEYPAFTFSQSQAAAYRIVEQYDPDMLEEIKARVAQGRWEVIASTWVEADKNLPDSESHARQLLYTKQYLKELLGLGDDAFVIDFEPDTFGHSRNVPEILADAGVRYYYHCRGYEKESIYRWRAPSGRSVLVYNEPTWYNGSIEPSLANFVPEFCHQHGMDTMLNVYGVGDHGGGPSRRDIERLTELDGWPIFPRFKFSTFRTFFGLVEQIADQLPVADQELNFTFDGCYSSQSEIKTANRKAEESLNEAEVWNAFSALCGGYSYHAEAFAQAWENVLFNHFHDIIPGSGVAETREYAMGQFQQSLAISLSRKTAAMRSIAALVDTSDAVVSGEDISGTNSEGAGVGFGAESFKATLVGRSAGSKKVFCVFNSAPFERSETVELIVWNWDAEPDGLAASDGSGAELPCQVLDRGWNNYWFHKYLRVLVFVTVPACGYATVVLSKKPCTLNTHITRDARTQAPDQFVLENSHLKAVFDTKSAALLSFVDKAAGRELVDTDRPAGIFRYIEEDDKGGSAWTVGRYMNVHELTENVKLRTIDYPSGDLRQGIRYEIRFRESTLQVDVTLDRDSRRLSYAVECDWRELGKPGVSVPQLGFFLPLGYACDRYRYDVPFGTIDRQELAMDVPGLRCAVGLAKDGGSSLMLVTDSKSGFRGCDNALAVTLIRSTCDPDPYPEFGRHRFAFSLCVAGEEKMEALNTAYACCHPIEAVSAKAGDGALPLSQSFLTQKTGSVALTAVKMAEDGSGSVLIRAFETEGQKTTAVFETAFSPRRAFFTDLSEAEIKDAGDVLIDDSTVSFELAPHSIASVRLEFDRQGDVGASLKR